MPKPVDVETRALIVLQGEVDRVVAAAERVSLVVQAMAKRKGLSRTTRRVDPDFNFGA
ncbi:hypothetical protein [Bradyrhizobium pachyrhizi]|uniref:hypothetical protein n=1 Tax=Bradyrhizobium pachyrhizi TaxID=280333 RepID=UPI000B1B7981|nr:hypothetical protein [Bradyrhizobium pachyrhizi]